MDERQISTIIKNNLLEDFHTNNRTGLYAATQKLMAYNSNKIEGSTLTSEQTASLFDTGTLVSNGIEVYRAKDIEETTGHFKMFNYMFQHIDEPLSQELIKGYHYQLKNGVFEDMANGYPVGEYKNRVNEVSDVKTAKPAEVPEKITELLNDYHASQKTLHDIAVFHANFEHIHPFQDGNGRTGRMIMVKQCLDNGLIPIIVRDDNKLVYYRALHSAQVNGDCSSLVELFEQSQKEYLARIEDFVEDYVRYHKKRTKETEKDISL